MPRFSLTIAGLLLTAASALAQDTYTLTVKETGVGESTVVQRTQTIRSLTVVSDTVDMFDREVLRNEDVSTESVAYGETILAREPGQPATRLRRKYQTAQVQAPNRVADLPYAGTTVLIEKKGDRFCFQTSEGRVFGAQDAPRLDKEFNHGWAGPLELERLLLARVPVRVGEKWSIDLEAFLHQFLQDNDMEIDAAKATGTGVLNKVWQKDDHRFGEIAYQIDLPLKAMGRDKARVLMTPGSHIAFQLTMSICIDGSVEATTVHGTMKLDATTTLPLPDGRMGKAVITLEVQSDEKQASQ